MKKTTYFLITIVLLMTTKLVYAEDSCAKEAVEQMAKIVYHEVGFNDVAADPKDDFFARITTSGVVLNNANKHSGNTWYERMMNLTDGNYGHYYDYRDEPFNQSVQANRSQLVYIAALVLSGKYTLPKNMTLQANPSIVSGNGNVWTIVTLKSQYENLYFGYEGNALNKYDALGNEIKNNTPEYYKEIAEKLKRDDYSTFTSDNVCDQVKGISVGAHNNEFCYYDSTELRAILEIKEQPLGLFNSGYTDVRIDTVGTTLSKTKNTHVFNWVGGDVINNHNNVTKHKSGGNYIKFEPIYNNSAQAIEKTDETKCPKHLIVQRDKSSYSVWATNDDTIASNAVTYINENGYSGYSATFTKNEKKITEEQYYESFIQPELGGEDVKVTCKSLFGDVTDDGSKNDTGTPSLGYMVNKVMQYIRIIVPILIILLGTIDLSKAALASKEDQMKKAQTDFIKRLLLGVAIFFAPVLVRLVMHLADLVWTGVHDAPCNLP